MYGKLNSVQTLLHCLHPIIRKLDQTSRQAKCLLSSSLLVFQGKVVGACMLCVYSSVFIFQQLCGLMTWFILKCHLEQFPFQYRTLIMVLFMVQVTLRTHAFSWFKIDVFTCLHHTTPHTCGNPHAKNSQSQSSVHQYLYLYRFLFICLFVYLLFLKMHTCARMHTCTHARAHTCTHMHTPISLQSISIQNLIFKVIIRCTIES